MHSDTVVVDSVGSNNVNCNEMMLSQPNVVTSSLRYTPEASNVNPFHSTGSQLMIGNASYAQEGAMVKFNVLELSQPAALVPIQPYEPDDVNWMPFHSYSSQLVTSTSDSVASRRSNVISNTLGHPSSLMPVTT